MRKVTQRISRVISNSRKHDLISGVQLSYYFSFKLYSEHNTGSDKIIATIQSMLYIDHTINVTYLYYYESYPTAFDR